MKAIKAILVVLVVCGVSCFAQQTTSATPPATTTVTNDPNSGIKLEVSTDAYKLIDGNMATVISARVPVTEYYSAKYQQWQIPSAAAQLFLAGVEYRRPLSDLIHSKTAAFDLSKLQVFASGLLGTKRDALGNNPRPAFGVEGGVGFPVGTLAGGQLGVELKVGYVGQFGRDGVHVLFQNSPTVAPGVFFKF